LRMFASMFMRELLYNFLFCYVLIWFLFQGNAWNEFNSILSLSIFWNSLWSIGVITSLRSCTIQQSIHPVLGFSLLGDPWLLL
jgi:uncharacterized membrane protein